MNYALSDQYVVITGSGVPVHCNVGDMSLTFPNAKWSVVMDNSSGEPVYTKHPGWRMFECTLNIPQQDASNEFLARFTDLTISYLWKDISGTTNFKASKAKIMLVDKGAQIEAGNTQWKIIGKMDVINPGSNVDLELKKLLGLDTISSILPL